MKNNDATTSLRLGARSSPLSRAQVQEFLQIIQRFHPSTSYETHWFNTQGDLDKLTSLRDLDCTDFFTNTLDSALLEGKIDFALHSAKDLPKCLHKDLSLAALTYGVDKRDCLVFSKNISLEKLKLKSSIKIATSSKRREDMVKEILPQATFSDLRGTVNERLAYVDKGQYDAIVVASAALIRLGIHNYNLTYLSGETPSGQGQLAVVIRKKDRDLKTFFQIVDWRQQRPRSLYLGLPPSKYYSQIGVLDCRPIIKIESAITPWVKDEIQKNLQQSEMVLITSKQSARHMLGALSLESLSQLMETPILAIGPASAQIFIDKGHQRVHYLPYGSCAEDMTSYLKTLNKKPKIFYPHSEKSRPIIRHFLEREKWDFDSLPLYKTSYLELDKSIHLDDYDEIIFTSPSTVEAFFSDKGNAEIDSEKITAIGRTTKKSLEKYCQGATLAINLTRSKY